LGLTREEVPAPQAELLLLPKGHEMIEISDNKEDMDEMIAEMKRMKAVLQASR